MHATTDSLSSCTAAGRSLLDVDQNHGRYFIPPNLDRTDFVGLSRLSGDYCLGRQDTTSSHHGHYCYHTQLAAIARSSRLPGRLQLQLPGFTCDKQQRAQNFSHHFKDTSRPF
ncbi:unnamed protein product [Polarella glacialis]|uniref:Uncharacterized protein n=1 Tax=Polarella glacialis TaxID=89957 RepID=A0A813IPQ9_POLGL|nr:unnamed protein product [Polarella glacialis]